MSLVTVSGLSKFYGAEEVFHDVSFRIERGDHLALVGANGAGKSTLLRIVAGLEQPNSGTVTVARGVRVAYLEQVPHFEGSTLWEAMLSVFREALDAQEGLHLLERRMAAGEHDQVIVDEYGRLQTRAETAGYDYESRIERVLTGLQLEPELWFQPIANLSGGQRTRANLARLLLGNADVLLLDEPTNHLDIPALEWLEGYLRELRRAFLIVAHDRYLLNRVTTRTLELSNRRLRGYDAPYDHYLQLKAEREERHRREYAAQQEHVARTEEFIRRYGAGQRSKEARGRRKRLDRLERIDRPEQDKTVHLSLAGASRTGDKVLDTEDLAVGYDRPLLRLGTALVRRGERVALLGPNGSGKTTLLKTLRGNLTPIEGSFRWGSRIRLAYYAQTLEGLDPNRSVLAEIQSVRPMSEEAARSHLGSYLFAGDDVFKQVDRLSGGERSRVALAKLLLEEPNVLLLDEPTNHLDLASRDALESVLAQFGGTILFVSHDRALIDALADMLWMVEDGVVVPYRGTYTDLVQGRAQRLSTLDDPTPVSSDVSELEAKAAALAGRVADAAATVSLRELETLVEEYGGLYQALDQADTLWRTRLHRGDR